MSALDNDGKETCGFMFTRHAKLLNWAAFILITLTTLFWFILMVFVIATQTESGIARRFKVDDLDPSWSATFFIPMVFFLTNIVIRFFNEGKFWKRIIAAAKTAKRRLGSKTSAVHEKSNGSSAQKRENEAGDDTVIQNLNKTFEFLKQWRTISKISTIIIYLWITWILVLNLGPGIIAALFSAFAFFKCAKCRLGMALPGPYARAEDASVELEEGSDFSSKNEPKVIDATKRSALEYAKSVLPILCGFAGFWFIVLFTYVFYSGYNNDTRRIFVGGHRGQWMTGVAENSFRAVINSRISNYDFTEFDIRSTKDKKLAISHDDTLDRTTNCTGSISDYTLKELSENCVLQKRGGGEACCGTESYPPCPPGAPTDVLIDDRFVYSDFEIDGKLYPSPLVDGHRCEYPYEFSAMLKYVEQNELISNIDIKQDIWLKLPLSALDNMCESENLQNQFGACGPMFHQDTMSAIQPNMTMEKDFLFYTTPGSMVLPFNANIYASSFELTLINPGMIANAHRAGMKVLIYFLFVESEFVVDFAIKLGADGIMLNNPDACGKWCSQEGNWQVKRNMLSTSEGGFPGTYVMSRDLY